MTTATLSSKSQLVIPAEVRRQLGINPGDRLLLEVQGDQLVIRKASLSDVEALAAYQGALWQGYGDELDRDRDQWDRCDTVDRGRQPGAAG